MSSFPPAEPMDIDGESPCSDELLKTDFEALISTEAKPELFSTTDQEILGKNRYTVSRYT
jgi:hypothetical protein